MNASQKPWLSIIALTIGAERVGASLRCLRQAGLAGKSGKYSGLNKSRYERTIL
ncbi:Uncharacterised protein [Neisseria meningitidis]|nr:Uncharacterised protein [Neisseria meningitidis]